MMQKKPLIIHIPVIHKGYLDFFEKVRNEVSRIYIIEEKLLAELSEFKPDIASIDSLVVKKLLESLGFLDILILSKDNIGELDANEIILVQDEVSRNLHEKYLNNKKHSKQNKK